MTTADDSARLRLLYDLGVAFAARIELDELIPLVVAKCREVLDAEAASILLVDAERDELYFPYVADEDPEVAARVAALRFPVDQGIAGAVVQSGRSVRVDDVSEDPRFYGEIDRKSGLTTRNLVCSPLSSRQGVIGVIQVINRRAATCFSDHDLEFLDALAGSVAVAIENARLYGRTRASEEQLRAQVGALRRDLARTDRFSEIVGTGRAMREVFQLMESAAASPIAVLIEGETGTGKELVARGIHRAGARAEGPFVAVNCAAVPETLLESELFGHRRGAFTGATHDHRGLFEAAAGGSMFLDEVGEMPASMQAKLLRVLQESEVVPVGETRPRKVDVRVISATNRDLATQARGGAFREDLYYRLAAFPIQLPALRERRDDIPLLAARFVTLAAERHRKHIAGIDAAAMELLTAFEWRGNVRELQNEIERAVALSREGETIASQQLSAKLRAQGASLNPAPTVVPPVRQAVSGAPSGGPLRQARAAFEAHYIKRALEAQGGNVSRAAEALGLSRVMLQRKMKTYRLR